MALRAGDRRWSGPAGTAGGAWVGVDREGDPGAGPGAVSALGRALRVVDGWFDRLYGWRWNPLYQSGAAAVALLGVLLVTGVYLLLFYRIGAPYDSVARLTDQVWAGRWIRSLHRFAGDAAVVAVAVHAVRMVAQGRSWGPRVLAWVSGLGLLFLLFVCGWTGYAMVWDVQARELVVEGARLLDVLPLFSEPIGRAFVGERALPSQFFFLNLFLHIALPIGMGLLLWVHVSRVARPVVLPSRPVLWGGLGLLLGLSVFWPVGMAPEAEALRLSPRAPYDAFYAFWLPVTRALPPGAAWGMGGVLALGLLLVPVWTRRAPGKRRAPSRVDERVCTGCEQCALDCPYEAISLVPRTDGRDGVVARVDPAMCVSCGICVGSCAPMGVGPAGRTGRDQLARVRAWLREHRPGPRDVVVIACERSPAGWRGGGVAPPLLRVGCGGELHTSSVEVLLRGGAGGVLVVACPPRDCRNREGGKWLEERLWHGREAELQARVDRRRVALVFAGAGDDGAVRAALARLEGGVVRLAREGGRDPEASGVLPRGRLSGTGGAP